MKKIAFIVESGPMGAEIKVIPHLAKQIFPDVEFDVVPLDDKRKLFSDCGEWTKEYLDKGFDKVIILWDLKPVWVADQGQSCCLVEELEIIQESLDAAGVTSSKVYKVCLVKMLEAWLIADERAIRDLLSTKAHAVRVARVKKPEEHKDPKSKLMTIFKQARGRRYDDGIDAIKIAKKMQDLSRVRRLSTFQRFEKALLA